MTYYLYSVYDRIVGIFNNPVQLMNDALATRIFQASIAEHPNSLDMELYKVASMDIQTGLIQPLNRPEFVCRFEPKTGIQPVKELADE